MFLLLCSIVFVTSWTYKVIADTLINSEIFAPALTEGATITSPAADSVFTTQDPITVGGVCPSNSYVELYINGTFSGVSLCSADRTFVIQAYLFTGTNKLVTKDFNITDQQGPDTTGIVVSLELPEAANPPNKANSTGSGGDNSTLIPAPLPLLQTSAFHWQTFSTNATFAWKLDLSGGAPPYVVTVDWGDGQTSNYRFPTDPVFTITHAYSKAGYYPVTVSSTDSIGSQQVMQLAALINSPSKSFNFFGNSTTPTSTSSKGTLTAFFVSSKNWLWIAWPSLIVVTLMTFSFWLGELEDKKLLLTKKRLAR